MTTPTLTERLRAGKHNWDDWLCSLCHEAADHIELLETERDSNMALALDWARKHGKAVAEAANARAQVERLREVLEEVQRNSSLEGFPEDAPDQVAFIKGIVDRTLASTAPAEDAGKSP